MSLGIPVLECVCMLGCARWMCKRCLYTGTYDSDKWSLAAADDFEPVPRICRVVLAVYEEDLSRPQWAPAGGYGMDVDAVVRRVGYDETQGRSPPYLIYVDHDAMDIVLAIRGLNLGKESDYAVLLDKKLGQEGLDGGYVHHGLLRSATWLLENESDTLTDLVLKNPLYTLTFAGHSLGSGVAAVATILVVNVYKLGNISRERLRCFAIAPARCVTLNLAIRYADIIKSIILQDDFLPRTATPLEDIFESIFCLPCLLFFRCMRDTCISEQRMLNDPRRLYAPGRIYHIVERRYCRRGRYPPAVRTAVPVDGRFEHIILSCNATSDHSIVWIEQRSQKALEVMMENESALGIPEQQKMGKEQTLKIEQKEEHRAALEKAVTLKIPHAFSPSPGTAESGRLEAETDKKAMLINAEVMMDKEDALEIPEQ